MNGEKEQPHLTEPLVQQNAFRGRSDVRISLPPFSVVRNILPVPVLPSQPEWVDSYWAAWETVWSKLAQAPSVSPLDGPVLSDGSEETIILSEAAVTARLAGFAHPGFDLIHLLDNFYAAQHDDGFIPREIDIRTGNPCQTPYDPNSTGPNLFAWTGVAAFSIDRR
ncbi:MAG: hypothetical protein R3C44_16480 [Chloroflexota bacterium]